MRDPLTIKTGHWPFHISIKPNIVSACQCFVPNIELKIIFLFQMSGQGTVQKGGLKEEIHNVISLSVLLKLLQLQADTAKEREQTLLQFMVKWR